MSDVEEREALEGALRYAFWKPENGGQWPRIADAILASDWLRELRAKAWDEGWHANDDRVRSFENPYRSPDGPE